MGILSHFQGNSGDRLGGAGFVLLLACVLSCPSQQSDLSTSPSAGTVEALVRQGRLDESRIQLQAELQKNPASIDAYNLLGIIDTEQQDYVGALSAFQKALQLAPHSVRTLNNLGNLYLAEKEFNSAEGEFRAGLLLAPGNRDGNYDLGVLMIARGRPQDAIAYFRRVRPSDRETRLHMVEALLASGRTSAGLQLAAQLSSDDANDVRLHFSLGLLLASQRQYRLAQLELEKADALQPATFEVLYNLGRCYLESGDARAATELSRALALQPESAEALYLLAQAYQKQARLLDALELLVRAHKAAPGNTNVVLLMARISMDLGYYEDAVPLLESGMQEAPENIDLRLALGESYLRSDHIEKAKAEFEHALRIQPSLHAYAFLGLAQTDLGRFEDAQHAFQDGLRLDSHDAFCLYGLGSIAERQGHPAAAMLLFQRALAADPQSPGTLLELAGLYLESNRLTEAQTLLRHFVQVSHSPSAGYYRLAMVERKLHQTAAAERDLELFQRSAGDAPASYRYEDLFHYLDQRSQSSSGSRTENDLTDLISENTSHPDQPELLYLLAAAYLRSGKIDDGRATITRLDNLRAGDYRTLTGAGVLFAQYHFYDDAIRQFEAALRVNPGSDDTKFDLANAWFRTGHYPQALDTAQQVSEPGRKDDAYITLLADIYTHRGETARAIEIYSNGITRNPDDDQNYLSLALLRLRQSDIQDAKQTLLQGQKRLPASGKIRWGLGIVSIMEGETGNAAMQLERAVDLLPEWPGTYSMLGAFYFESGQTARAREVLERFRSSNNSDGLDLNRIDQVLTTASTPVATRDEPLSADKRQKLLQLAVSLADKTL